MEKRIFDENTKRKLSGLLPFAPDSFVAWTPEAFSDFPTEAQPVFHVRPFDSDTKRYIRSAVQSGIFDIEHARKSVQMGIPFWLNLLSLPEMKETPYSPEAFGGFPDDLVWILYRKCAEITFGMSKEEKEALESQPRAELAPSIKAAENAGFTLA